MKESRKFETEFEEFQQKNAQQKEEWIKANPEKAKAMRQAEGEDWAQEGGTHLASVVRFLGESLTLKAYSLSSSSRQSSLFFNEE